MKSGAEPTGVILEKELAPFLQIRVQLWASMFVKLTRSGSRSFEQLVESYRDESGKPCQRTIATVGRLDETGGAVQSLLSGLLRATGQPAASAGTPGRARHAQHSL